MSLAGIINTIAEQTRLISHSISRASSKKLWFIGLSTFISLLIIIQIAVSETSASEAISKIIPETPLSSYFKDNNEAQPEEGEKEDEDKGEENKQLSDDEILSMPLLDRLKFVYPYKIDNTPFPKTITQSDRDKNVGMHSKLVKSWFENEPDFKHYVYDDRELYRLLLRHFGALFPEIIETFNTLPRNILRFDFFRYCALFLNGGIYADTDTEKMKPFSSWISFNETLYGEENTLGAVTGLEGECDCADWKGIFSRRVQLCQWTMQSKPRHPIFAILINNIVKALEQYNSETKIWTKDGVEYDFSKGKESYYNGIMELTGPPAYTDAVFAYVNSLTSPRARNFNNLTLTWEKTRHKNPENKELSYGHGPNVNLGWENITHIKEPLIIGDVMIVPEPYFNGKENRDEEVMLVRHHYHGSWKSASSSKREAICNT